MPTIPPPLTGLIVVALLYAAIGALSGHGLGWLSNVVTGADGRASTSKFQLLLWTSIVLWAYPTLVARGFQDGAVPGFLAIPGNVMLLLGLGTGTAVGALLIAGHRGFGNKTQRSAAVPDSLRYLVVEDDESVSLPKAQIMAWTFLIAGIYVASVLKAATGSEIPTGLPGVDDAALGLLGLSHAGYLTVKGIAATQPTGSAFRTGLGHDTGGASGTTPTGGPGVTPASAPVPQPGMPDAAAPPPDHG